jgi:hypothetical protein
MPNSCDIERPKPSSEIHDGTVSDSWIVSVPILSNKIVERAHGHRLRAVFLFVGWVI